MEKANHVAAQRFWRTLADDASVEQAQVLLDKWCSTRGDVRMRATTDGKMTVATVAAAEPLRPAPATPFPATLSVERLVSAQALVAYRGNFYSVPPELAGAPVTVTVRLGALHLDIATAGGHILGRSPLPVVLARHAIAPDGAGVLVRDHGHVVALERAAMAAASGSMSAAPHRRKQRIPPGTAARAAAAALRTGTSPQTGPVTGPATGTETKEVVVDLARYAAAARGRNTLT